MHWDLIFFQLLTVNASKIIGVDTVKETVQRLTVNHSVCAIKVSLSFIKFIKNADNPCG